MTCQFPLGGVGLDEWLARLPISLEGKLRAALEADQARTDGLFLEVSDSVIASLSGAEAKVLSLAPDVPLGFDLRLKGVLSDPDAHLVVQWNQPGKKALAKDVSVDGLWLTWQARRYRIPSPLLDVLGQVEVFNRTAAEGSSEKYRLWARIRSVLGDTLSSTLSDHFLRACRVVPAQAMTIDIVRDANGDVQLEPVLLAQHENLAGQLLGWTEALPEVDQRAFVSRLDDLPIGASAFPVKSETYVSVDEDLQQCLAALKRIRTAPASTRLRAALNPAAVLREVLGRPDDSPFPFVETERYADRVRDIAEWNAPVLPWVKVDPQNWDAPVEAGLRVDGVEVPMNREAVSATIARMAAALAAEERSVSIEGNAIPVSLQNLGALKALEQALLRLESGPSDEGATPSEWVNGKASGPRVLVIETNFESGDYARTTLGRRAIIDRELSGLRATLKLHQSRGLGWLQHHYLSGSPGALLCDDMGLGKTLQALSFCRWLRERMLDGQIETAPILIVGPVGLLRNWEAEIKHHLHDGALGTCASAYGEKLRLFKRGKHSDGTARLDTSAIGQAGVVLVSYESLSNLQLDFGTIRFAAMVLDEAQKVKSPSARVTHAVKAMHSDFTLVMTGTPVENRLADLWCIADAAQPTLLGSLREFSATYEGKHRRLESLREKIWEASACDTVKEPKLMLRRLKSEALQGLPNKREHVLKVLMPPRQEEAYRRTVSVQALAGAAGMLKMIQDLRRVSLHPVLAEGGATESDQLKIDESARFIGCFQVLDRVAGQGEKALIFLESLELQSDTLLPAILMRRYGMRQLPSVINGTVAPERRQVLVDRFQQGKGFDVMILSPKAGGVGLTLTAANHVIHLSRWWNPAVEDQCSDRAHRIGQQKDVHVYYPLALLPGAAESSFDVQLQRLMAGKRQLAHQLLLPPEFTERDFRVLLDRTLAAMGAEAVE